VAGGRRRQLAVTLQLRHWLITVNSGCSQHCRHTTAKWGDEGWRLPVQQAHRQKSRLTTATFISVCSGGSAYKPSRHIAAWWLVSFMDRPLVWPDHFFVHHQIPDGRGVAPSLYASSPIPVILSEKKVLTYIISAHAILASQHNSYMYLSQVLNCDLWKTSEICSQYHWHHTLMQHTMKTLFTSISV